MIEIAEGDGQVASGSASLPDPVDLDTEEQTLEREQNERDVLEALGECKCDYGMFVEDVTVIVIIKRLKGRLIAHKFNTGWTMVCKECRKEEERC
jgi:hypothetical protein